MTRRVSPKNPKGVRVINSVNRLKTITVKKPIIVVDLRTLPIYYPHRVLDYLFLVVGLVEKNFTEIIFITIITKINLVPPTVVVFSLAVNET